MLKGIKVGDVVVVMWYSYKPNHLVKVTAIHTDGVSGPFYELLEDGTIKAGREWEPFSFVGYGLYGISKTALRYPEASVSVVLNSEYTAVVSGDRKTVVVGCQTIPASKVLELAAYLKK